MPRGVYKRIKKISEETRRKISEALKGRKLSEETKQKISEVRKGMKFSEKHKQNISKNNSRCWLGRKHSEESRRKMSGVNKGEKSCFWKGGITPENKLIRCGIEYRLWREAVFARDNWTCQKCENRGGRLHPHHINNFADFPELRFAINNGITFCEECHKKFHKKYGIRNNTKEQIGEFITLLKEAEK